MKYQLATLGLGPLLLLQGRRVRRTTPSLPEPPGARQGCIGTGPALRLLILGDSAAAGVGAASQDEALAGQLVARLKGHFRVTWRLLARTGDTLQQVSEHLESLPAEPYDVVVTSIGVNDVTSRTGNAAWRRQHQRLLQQLTGRFGIRHVVHTALPPMHYFPVLPQPLRWYLGLRATQLTELLHPLAKQHPACEVLHLNLPVRREYMASDGFHPGPAAYAEWANAAAATIVRRQSSGK